MLKIIEFLRPRRAATQMSEVGLRLSRIEQVGPPVKDESTGVLYSGNLVKAAKELGKPVSEVTAVDLLDYDQEDLPDGPPSELGGEVPNYYRTRSESETRRLAVIGKALVDEYAEQADVEDAG